VIFAGATNGGEGLGTGLPSSRIKLYACSAVQMWFWVTGRGGSTWWMPCGKQDIMKMLELCRRMSRVVGIAEEDVALVLNQPAPTASDSLPYFLGYAHKLASGARMEVMPLSPLLLTHRPAWASFFLKRPPTVLVSTPADALQLAEILKRNTGARAKPEALQPHRRPTRQQVQARREC